MCDKIYSVGNQMVYTCYRYVYIYENVSTCIGVIMTTTQRIVIKSDTKTLCYQFNILYLKVLHLFLHFNFKKFIKIKLRWVPKIYEDILIKCFKSN